MRTPRTSLTTKFALVTGTSSGIGASVAHRLLDDGWHVLGVARRQPPFRHREYEHCAVDLGDTSATIHELSARLDRRFVETRWGRVGLVNNAAHTGLLGPVERLDVAELPVVLATNLVAPVWLMGELLRRTPADTPLRIVNVSTGAAVRGIAGLGGYGASKAALRMAGMVLGAEIEEDRKSGAAPRDVAILSFEPGTVDTPMQENARTSSRDTLPSVDLFKRFATEGALVPPAGPAADVVTFLESDGEPVFTERRYRAR